MCFMFMLLSNFGKRVVWVRSASVVPKRNNIIMTHCNVWVRQMPSVPKINNGSLIHCYVLVRHTPFLLKCNNGSLIHCYAWVRQMPIVPKTHVYHNRTKIYVGASMTWPLIRPRKWHTYRVSKYLSAEHEQFWLNSCVVHNA